MAVIPANNNTGLYNTTGVPATTGNDITVSGNVNANNFNATSQVNAGTNVTAVGNISAGGYFIGDGSLLTNIDAGNIVGGYGNANVAAFLASGTDSSNIVTTGNISGSYILGNGSQLTGLPATYGNANVAAYLPTFTGNLAGGNGSITNDLVVGGTIYGTFSGNISGNLVVPGANTQIIYNNNGNAGANPGLTFNTDSNVLSVVGSANVSALNSAGNVTGSNFIGNGQYLTNLPGANVTGTVALATSATTAGTVTTAAQPNITSVGTLSSLTTSGNVTVGGSLNSDDITSTGNVTVNGNQIITGNLTVQGTTTTINSNTITTNDKTITVANNQSTGANVDGAGLEAGNPAVATWLYNNASNTWKSSIGVSAVGNITGSYIFGNGSQLTGLPATYTNANVTTLLAALGPNTISSTGNITTTANISGGYILGNGSQLTGLPANYSDSNVTTLLAAFGSNTISTSGNITGGYILGNGSQLTGVISSYGDSNVNTHLAALGSNVISSTGNITTSANVSGAYVIGNGSALSSITGANVTGTVANATYATSAGSATTAGLATYVTGNAQANITSVGTLTSLAVTGNTNSGNISATGAVVAGGNISGNYILGNGSQLTGVTGTYGNTNVAAYLASGTNSSNIITTGNVTAAYINTSGASGNISGANYITANYFVGNGSLLTGVTTTANLAGAMTGDITGGNTYSINFIKDLALTGNISNPAGSTVVIEGITTTGVINSTGNISTTGNVTGGYLFGNGSLLTGVTASLAGSLTGNIDTGPYYIQRAGGSTLMGNVWVTGLFAANSISSPGGNYVDIEGITTTNGIVSQGNVQVANLISNAGVFTGTLSATSLVANTQIGNLLVLNQQVQTTQAADAGLTSALAPNPGQIFIGSGFNGNTSAAFDINNTTKSARLAVSDTYNLSNGNSVARALGVQNFANLTANITSTNARFGGITSTIMVGGGSAANTISGALTSIIATSGAVQLGGGTSGNLVSIGNTTAQYSIGVLAIPTINAGSTGGNVYGTLSQFVNSGTANTLVAHGIYFTGAGTYSNVYGVYMAGATNNYGFSQSTQARNATNYYFLKNEDDHAYNQIGQIKSYQETQYGLASSGGAVTVNKANGQAQLFTVSEAATMSFSNFITSSTVSATTRYMTDTVSVIVKQDATGRTITMPSGAAYKYASGTSTVPSTANSVSEIVIKAYYDTGAAATAYLITISPVFS